MNALSPHFYYHDNHLFAEKCSLTEIAQKIDTPCYVYSRQAIEQRWHYFQQTFRELPVQLCYAVKANSNLAVLNILAKLGAGFDIVSGGELARVLKAGGPAQHIVFSGVGKKPDEIHTALAANIGCFNIESEAELSTLNQCAQQQNTIASIAIRVNPDIAIDTHPYIATGLKENKFGVNAKTAFNLFKQAALLPHIRISGIACHLGSQIMETTPYVQALDKLFTLIDELHAQQIYLTHIDLGGGFGLDYQTGALLSLAPLAQTLAKRLAGRSLKLMLEPGRAIVAQAGMLITRIILLKSQQDKHFAIVDAGMNDLLRPALYQAWHDIIPVHLRNITPLLYDIVGPVCETADFLGKERSLAILPNDLLAITMAGAYGFVMSSNYNTRVRAAEIMVDNNHYHIVRSRENLQDLWANETCLP